MTNGTARAGAVYTIRYNCLNPRNEHRINRAGEPTNETAESRQAHCTLSTKYTSKSNRSRSWQRSQPIGAGGVVGRPSAKRRRPLAGCGRPGPLYRQALVALAGFRSGLVTLPLGGLFRLLLCVVSATIGAALLQSVHSRLRRRRDIARHSVGRREPAISDTVLLSNLGSSTSCAPLGTRSGLASGLGSTR